MIDGDRFGIGEASGEIALVPGHDREEGIDEPVLRPGIDGQSEDDRVEQEGVERALDIAGIQLAKPGHDDAEYLGPPRNGLVQHGIPH